MGTDGDFVGMLIATLVFSVAITMLIMAALLLFIAGVQAVVNMARSGRQGPRSRGGSNLAMKPFTEEEIKFLSEARQELSTIEAEIRFAEAQAKSFRADAEALERKSWLLRERMKQVVLGTNTH